MNEQEIRAKALEISVKTLALLAPEARQNFLNSGNKDIQEKVILASKIYEKHIKGN